MSTTLTYVPYVPQGFEGQPVDEVDALKRGRAVIVEEAERWTRGEWFDNDHPEVDLQDPYCNSWKVCAEGAVLIVTVGLHNQELAAWDDDVDIAEEIALGSCPWEVYVDDDIVNRTLYEAQDPRQRALYEQAIDRLGEVGRVIYERTTEITSTTTLRANYYNDSFFQTRDEVIGWFDETIAIAEASEDADAQR